MPTDPIVTEDMRRKAIIRAAAEMATSRTKPEDLLINLTGEELARIVFASFRAGFGFGMDNKQDDIPELFLKRFPGFEVATDGNAAKGRETLTWLHAIAGRLRG